MSSTRIFIFPVDDDVTFIAFCFDLLYLQVIVHEWGHFRWGLFDEYPRYASFYQDLDTGKIEATRCVLAIKGTEPIP